MTRFTVSFVYDEPSRLWEVFVSGASSPLEALQGFNAVLLTRDDAIPRVDCNKATLLPDGRYEISIGQLGSYAAEQSGDERSGAV